ncbi:enolase C-terminal domain-like protein [Nocardioides sp. MH1]|uniref:enolase C-terminal domain-like protein n=1 Tax=Nocardioides sp. MH1 TaxID=3242490 RepID=UPI00352300AA
MTRRPADGRLAASDPGQQAGEGPPVASIRATAYTIPTDAPEGDGTLTWDHTTLVLVEARAEDRTGIGYTYAPRAAVTVIEELLEPIVTGRSALDVEGAWMAMVAAVRNAGRRGLVGMAISAVDTALWDLAGHLLDQPLTAIWGARSPWQDPDASPSSSGVEIYGSGGFTTYDDDRLRDQLHHWLEMGCDKVKIKIGESWGTCRERDLDRVRIAQQTIGEDASLFVDANGAYTTQQACLIGSFLDMLEVTWFEEPVSSEDYVGLATVRDHIRADVAAGEYAADVADCQHLAPHIDCLQLDVTRCGGYTGWRHITADPAIARIELSGHCAPHLSVPVAAGTPRLRHLEYFHDHVRIERLLLDGCADPTDGTLPPSGGAGHGLTFRTSDAEEYRVA